LLVDEHSSSEDLPYRFNGKELDEETGLYYYGARYMQPMTSIWYGVDPLAEEYPNLSGYVYCVGNPVKLIDTDGRDYDVIYDGASITIRAMYFTDEASAESVNNAVKLWNDLNGQYTMDGLPIKFDFTVSVVTSAEIPEGSRLRVLLEPKLMRVNQLTPIY
jgi:RHS repeat-associated protein